ncbi:hypothetical protein H1R17_06000 [Flavobacterium sp. xlx-214]|nr:MULTISPECIES: hypothetical protein [unclassified Flavobacterium]MBA5792997.1 hypothetical protein [Flavobacterium sp. xlx-221]QMI84673.1 hypothetical protein H1R17_06000 [Flavobacterium sp. xlx-214]
MRLQTQYDIAVTAINNNEQLTYEEKQIALKQEKENFKRMKKGFQGSSF